jgi:hypothetical protein
VLRTGGRFLVVERVSKGAHGFTVTQAEELARRLVTAGFADARVDHRRKELVVTGQV